MKTWLLNRWTALRASYWFLPTLIAAVAVALSAVMLAIDRHLDNRHLAGLDWVYTGNAEGARSLLATVAGSMINVAGVTFSITIVALSLASSQFGPRLLRNFMRDTGTQTVLGVFIATFLYCLLILREVTGSEEQGFVPAFSITFAVLLTVMSVGVLIYFVHHVAASIQADNVIAAVAADLQSAIDRLCESGAEEPPRNEIETPDFASSATAVARASGYVQAVDYENLLELAIDNDLVIDLRYRAGGFVTEGTTVARVIPPSRTNEELLAGIGNAFFVGMSATEEQDVEFSIRQLVEIAIRALSPGVNDSFTAMNCVDWLSAVLSKPAQKGLSSGYVVDRNGRLRLIKDRETFAGIVAAAFDQIRQAAAANPAVSIRLLEALRAVALHAGSEDSRSVLMRHATLVRDGAQIHNEADRAVLEERFDRLRKELHRNPRPSF